MIELNDTLFDAGPVTILQALVLGTLLLLLGFALWRSRRISPGPVMRFSENPVLNAVGCAAILLALPGALLFLATLFELFRLTFSFPDASDEAALRRHATLMLSLLAAIGALVGLVFGVIRVFAVERQTTAQELKNELEAEALFNDKINAATQGLHARRQMTLGDDENTRNYWQDDIVQRNAAIDRLEGLAVEKPTEAPRIARLLSVYVRELSAEVPPQEPPDDGTPDRLRIWASLLPPLRSDMEKAAQTLGRLAEIALEPLENGEIDLRWANLQGADLSGTNLEGAALNGAHLQGANLTEARLRDANLSFAKLQAANAQSAQVHGARLVGANLEGASLVNAHFDKANLHRAKLRGAALSSARFSGANLFGAQLQGARLVGVRMTGADLGGASLHGAQLLDTELQGANLIECHLDGAILYGAKVSHTTELTAAGTLGVAFRSLDLSNVTQVYGHLRDVFGDASVTLPDGATPDHPDWPDHWAQEILDGHEFENHWRTWQATLPVGWDKDVPDSSKP